MKRRAEERRSRRRVIFVSGTACYGMTRGKAPGKNPVPLVPSSGRSRLHSSPSSGESGAAGGGGGAPYPSSRARFPRSYAS